MVTANPLVGFEMPRTGRVRRNPQHTFQVRHRPYIIQPFMLAPVLPGETLVNLNMQSRAVTDPIQSPLIGWWLEHYWFYVKLRDLAGRDDFTAMMLDTDYNLSAYHEADSVPYYHAEDMPNWAKLCLTRVVEEYFRDEGDTGTTLDGMPQAYVNRDSWLDSAINDADYSTTDDLNVDLDANATITASEVERAMRQWEFMRANNLVEADFEDYLRTFGIRIPKAEEEHVPELVRYSRSWQYPSNTIDPSDGSPSSAVSWSVQVRADKKRFFKEPGFLLGCTVARPKVYFKNQIGSAADMLSNAFRWLPAVLSGDPAVSLAKFAGTATTLGDSDGPLQNVTDDYWVDVRDLFIYGDQFVNFALTATDAGLVALPTATLQKKYAASADINALFIDSTGAGGKNLVRQDGVTSLSIMGTQRDMT